MQRPPHRRFPRRLSWPASRRRQVATVIAIAAIFAATVVASSRLLRLVFEDIDVVAYAGLFVACWVGAGGALVPVPGVRPVSWLLIVQQGAALDPVTVSLVAAAAMMTGQTSYFLATRQAVSARAARAGSPAVPPVDDEVPVAGDAGPPVDDAAPVSPSTSRVVRLRTWVEHQARRHATVMPFVVALVPSPATTVATTAAASLGTRYPRWALSTFAGYLVFSAVLTGIGRSLLAAARALFP